MLRIWFGASGARHTAGSRCSRQVSVIALVRHAWPVLRRYAPSDLPRSASVASARVNGHSRQWSPRRARRVAGRQGQSLGHSRAYRFARASRKLPVWRLRQLKRQRDALSSELSLVKSARLL